MRTAKTLISLGGCPGRSESSLGAHVILLVLSCGGSNIEPDTIQPKNKHISDHPELSFSLIRVMGTCNIVNSQQTVSCGGNCFCDIHIFCEANNLEFENMYSKVVTHGVIWHSHDSYIPDDKNLSWLIGVDKKSVPRVFLHARL